MKSNTAQLKIAEKYLGESCPKCCSMKNNCCCYYVCKTFREADNASLFYNGVTVTYCPNARKWCKANLAEIPLFIAMPSDVIFFDWELNGTPNHIGFVDHRYTDQQVCTLEGNTTSRYVVARRTREAKYVQGIYRPHFPTTYDLSKPLAIDGQFNYSSIAMLQSALGIKVDGILGRDTVKAMQKKVGVAQDGAWGAGTSKALQKMLKSEGFYKGAIDGCVYEGTVKALQQWCNKHGYKGATPTPTPTPKPTPKPVDDGKLSVTGTIEKKTVERMQEFFGTTKDGIISGQKDTLWNKYYPSFLKSVVGFSGKGSECVKKLQKWLGIKEDGVIGEVTVKAWQKKLGVTADGCFGTRSAKAWQTYLNTHDKAVYPTPPAKTSAQKIVDKAKEYAWTYGTAEKKWAYKTGSAKTAYKNALKTYMGHTSKIAQSDCGYFVSTCVRASGVAKDFLALKGNKDKVPSVPSTMKIVFKGNKIPSCTLQAGDIIRYKKTSGSQHTLMYIGDGKIAEAGREIRFPIIRKDTSKYNASDVKHSTIEVIRAR